MNIDRSSAQPLRLEFLPSRQEFENFLDIQLKLVGLHLHDVVSDLQSTYSEIEWQFSKIRIKYYCAGNAPVLRVAHNGHYTVFLYQLSRAATVAGKRDVADRLYALLRMVSAVDLYHEVELPRLWACDHPLGSVIGRGRFSADATLFFAQNCNVGNNKGIYPIISGNLHLYANSSVIGDTHIKGNVVMANGSCAIDAGQLFDCIVFGQSPKLVIKTLDGARFKELSPFVFDHSQPVRLDRG